jgi:hypothetical protein
MDLVLVEYHIFQVHTLQYSPHRHIIIEQYFKQYIYLKATMSGDIEQSIVYKILNQLICTFILIT